MRKEFLSLPTVYPITDTSISRLSHAEQVAFFADGGATFVQLREKRMPALQFYEQAKAAQAVAAQRGVQLIINDRVDIALALGGVGVHLGQDDLPPEAARRLLGEEAVIGYSTHSVEQAVQATRFPIDYLAIGPIFPTATKENPSPVVGLDGLRAVRSVIGNLPLVAIGGITPANLPAVIDAGANSGAMISGLWSAG
ncbi:MAG TPA: thiamine phosphate synthase [Pyrinomonadaceae bacterium]|nr:thiamine phosphate synthase [Pyrinomonadaceae bacterium]